MPGILNSCTASTICSARWAKTRRRCSRPAKVIPANLPRVISIKQFLSLSRFPGPVADLGQTQPSQSALHVRDPMVAGPARAARAIYRGWPDQRARIPADRGCCLTVQYSVQLNGSSTRLSSPTSPRLATAPGVNCCSYHSFTIWPRAS